MKREPKPCPFCKKSTTVGLDGYQGLWWVRCCNHRCGAGGPMRTTELAAIKAWDAAWKGSEG